MSDVIPSQVKSLIVRPLDKGIHKEVPSQDIPDGGFTNVEGMIGSKNGPRRRPAYTSFAAGGAAKYNPTDLATIWKTDGTQISLMFTEKTLYQVNPLTGVAEIAWAYSTGTITVSGTSVTGSGTAWNTNDILPGDVIRVSTEEAVIATVVDATHLTLVSATLTNGSTLSYSIQRTFSGGANVMPDWVVFQNKLLIADGKRPLMKYDPTSGTISYWTTSASKKILATLTNMYSTGTVSVTGTAMVGSGTTWTTNVVAGDTVRIGIYEDTVASVTDNTNIVLSHSGVIPTQAAGTSYAIWRKVGIDCIPCCVAVVNDPTVGLNRVWLGCTYDATDGWKRQRIRWSALADPTDFSISTNYVDLEYISGAVRKLLQFGTTLAAYFDDAIFVGSQTNYPLLPLDFRRVESGGMGLVGSKAVTTFVGGHFYVSQDDIYFLAYGQMVPERIGTPIISDVLRNCNDPRYVYTTIDPQNTRIVFGFPTTSTRISVLYSFDYRAKCWTKETVDTTMIANPLVQTSVTWDSLTGSWNALIYTWDNLSFSAQFRSFYIEHNKALWQLSLGGTSDPGSIAIQTILETKDHDFGEADYLKSVVRLSLKVEDSIARSVDLLFSVEVSTDRGRTWKSVGILNIPSTEDEGCINFRSKGSTFRARLTSSSLVAPYEVTEYGLRARAVGEELSFGTQA